MSSTFFNFLRTPEPQVIFAVAAGAAAVLLGRWLWRLSNIQLDPMEPPLVKPVIPFIGHILGLMWYSHDYLAMICEQSGYSVCTIPMLTRKAYVLGSPSAVHAAFRKKEISFAPFAVEFVSRMDLLSPGAKKAYAEGLHESVIQTFSSTMHGRALEDMNAVALDEVARLLPDGEHAVPVADTWHWLRSVMTLSATTALFGRQNNPFHVDASLVDTYWGFEAGDVSGRAPLTDLTDRRSKKDHAKLVVALRDYFDAGHDHPIASPIGPGVGQTTTQLANIQRERGYTSTELGATFVVVLHGALVNMVPTMFWTAMYIFSQPTLLARLREELLSVVTRERSAQDGKDKVLVNVGKIDTTCPLLLSVLRETQRLVSLGTLHRRALQDTIIHCDGDAGEGPRQYLFKKGTAMLLSIKRNHRDPAIWGNAVDEFDADRFTKDKINSQDLVEAHDRGENEKTSSHDHDEAVRLRKKAYLPFGGGKELCPGRHFATSEILGTIVILALGYDIAAHDGGVLKLPEFAPPKMTQTTARPGPNADLRAQVKRRSGWENVVWGVREPGK